MPHSGVPREWRCRAAETICLARHNHHQRVMGEQSSPPLEILISHTRLQIEMFRLRAIKKDEKMFHVKGVDLGMRDRVFLRARGGIHQVSLSLSLQEQSKPTGQ